VELILTIGIFEPWSVLSGERTLPRSIFFQGQLLIGGKYFSTGPTTGRI